MLRLSQFNGFNSQGKLRTKLEYIGGSTISWGGVFTTSTPLDFDLGQEAPDRYIFVCFTSNLDSTPVSGTLEGEALTLEVNERDSGDDLSAMIWSVSKPTGTTGQTLVITKNNNAAGSGRVDLFRGLYVTDPNVSFDSGQVDSPIGTISWTTLNVPLGGSVVACAASDGTGNTVTWTGVDEVSDVTVGSCNMSAAMVDSWAGDSSFSASVQQALATSFVAAILTMG